MAKFTGHTITKRRELLQLQLFKECLFEIKDAEILIEKADPPDGILRMRDKNISIELTEIFWDEDIDGFNKKAQESIADMIMDLAEEQYSKLGLPSLQVNVSFTDKFGLMKYGEFLNLNSGDKKRLSNYIVQKVIECMPLPENELFEIPDYNENWERILDSKIQSIYVGQYSELTENCWSASGGGVIPPITIEKISILVDKKNKDLKRYKHSFDKSWLVIVEDWIGMSGYFSFRNVEGILNTEIETEFDRVFILRSKRREVVELKIAQ